MIIDKELLINFGKFLFRSGEECYKHLGYTELDKNIEDYVIDTFKEFIKSTKERKEAQNE